MTRRRPKRSASAPIARVAITFTQIAAAKGVPISFAPNPREASHPGQNGNCAPLTRTAAA